MLSHGYKKSSDQTFMPDIIQIPSPKTSGKTKKSYYLKSYLPFSPKNMANSKSSLVILSTFNYSPPKLPWK
jgi:hypothetical protein